MSHRTMTQISVYANDTNNSVMQKTRTSISNAANSEIECEAAKSTGRDSLAIGHTDPVDLHRHRRPLDGAAEPAPRHIATPLCEARSGLLISANARARQTLHIRLPDEEKELTAHRRSVGEIRAAPAAVPERATTLRARSDQRGHRDSRRDVGARIAGRDVREKVVPIVGLRPGRPGIRGIRKLPPNINTRAQNLLQTKEFQTRNTSRHAKRVPSQDQCMDRRTRRAPASGPDRRTEPAHPGIQDVEKPNHQQQEHRVIYKRKNSKPDTPPDTTGQKGILARPMDARKSRSKRA